MLGLTITALQAAVVLILIWYSTDWMAHPQGRTVPAAEDAPPKITVLRLSVPDTKTKSHNLTTHAVSCPLYSGPGYDATRHASRDVTLPEFEAPFASTPHPPRWEELLPLHTVILYYLRLQPP